MEIVNPSIDGGRPFDWGRASVDYARYRDIYPQSFYRGVGASLSAEAVAQWEKEHLALLAQIAPASFEVQHYAAMAELRKKDG